MVRLPSSALFGGAAVLLASAVLAQGGAPAADDSQASTNDIVVNGYRDIVVNGRAIRCRPTRADPLNTVDLRGAVASAGLMTVIPSGADGFVLTRNLEQMTGPEYWQRVGVGMAEYVFRGPVAEKPMCVGGRAGSGNFAGFRRIVDAAPYRGHRLRFTVWVASANADQVSFWLAAGSPWHEKPVKGEKVRPNQLTNGGNTNHVRFAGNNGWTPVLLETGPVGEDANHISYGFNLQGSGDAWFYQPKLEVVTDPADAARKGDRIVIGHELK